MIGRALGTSDARYTPGWGVYKDWVIQAQYFWKKKGARFAQAGNIVHVRPGEEITTVIRYDAGRGEITAVISAPTGESRIVIPRPYPNEQPPLFSNWREFFERAAARSRGLLVRPLMNVETHEVDQQTLCSTLPFTVGMMSVPGVGHRKEKYAVTREGSFSCSGPMAALSF